MTTQTQTANELFQNTRRDDGTYLTANPHHLFRYREMTGAEYASFMDACAGADGVPASSPVPTCKFLLCACLSATGEGDHLTSQQMVRYFGIPEPTADELKAAAKHDPRVGLAYLTHCVVADKNGAADFLRRLVHVPVQAVEQASN